jgi:hypothetical protein
LPHSFMAEIYTMKKRNERYMIYQIALLELELYDTA